MTCLRGLTWDPEALLRVIKIDKVLYNGPEFLSPSSHLLIASNIQCLQAAHAQ